MRPWLLLCLVLAGCTGADANPVKVAERFHERRAAGDDGAVHALLTAADRNAVPQADFPAALPPRLVRQISTPGRARLDSVSILAAGPDTTTVVLHLEAGAPDTLRLLAARETRPVLGYHRERVRWRVSMGVAEQAMLDSMAVSMRSSAGRFDPGALEQALTYLSAAERYPTMARPSDVDAARITVRRAEAVARLQVDLRVTESFTGSRFVEGRIENPTRTRISTLGLVVRDGAGEEERVVLWDVVPGRTPVRELTRLRTGPLSHRVDRIEIF